MTPKKNIEEVIIEQSTSRIEGIKKANEKAMDMDIERVLKQSEIIFILNGFLVTILTLSLLKDNILSILLFFFAIISLTVQSINIRNIRNKISIKMKQYFLDNSGKLDESNAKLLKCKTIDKINNIIQDNKYSLDTLANSSIKKINSLIREQDIWKFVSLINLVIVIIMLFIKYGVWSLIIGNLCSK